jgi:hypothetical protein
MPHRGPVHPGYAEFAPCLPVRRPCVALPGLAADCAHSIFHTRNDVSLVVEDAHLTASGLERHPGGQSCRCRAGRGPSPGDGGTRSPTFSLPAIRACRVTSEPPNGRPFASRGPPCLPPPCHPGPPCRPGRPRWRRQCSSYRNPLPSRQQPGSRRKRYPSYSRVEPLRRVAPTGDIRSPHCSSALLRLQRQQNVDRGVDVRDEVVGFGGA